MPLDQSIKKVVILGSGPIKIGQACEFDYSGTQACKALMEKGLEVILVNSNPATIMTDPEIATRVYIEPLKVSFLKKILEIEKPDAIIPTLGGQTALNLALELDASGILSELNVRMLGAQPEVIEAAEDREKFKGILDKIGAHYPKSLMVKELDSGLQFSKKMGFPLILRPNFTLGGGGGGIAYSLEEFKTMLAYALHESPTTEVLVEESILGWVEYELEVMRDDAGTFVVVCSIENIDPCGVHTGDSITVAPQQTLNETQYQEMRTEAQKIIEEVGVKTGGANVQFAVDPKTGRRVVIEMNPRVSRSSALASKATGFPIAKIAALVAVGFELSEVVNDITKSTPSCFEPALDYVVTKIPKFAFEKFTGTKDELTTQMKSVGEVMSIGRTFKESFLKAINSLETEDFYENTPFSEELLAHPNSKRIYQIFIALREGKNIDYLEEHTKIIPWYLDQFKQIVDLENSLNVNDLNNKTLLKAKRNGFSDRHIAMVTNSSEEHIKKLRDSLEIKPNYLMVDTCAGEFKSETPYFYSTYWSDKQSEIDFKDGVVILGSGPNRIGQGIEFDYSCVRGVKSLRALGNKVAMINSNPETVSTDYDTADVLFFEPLAKEYVLEVLDYLRPQGFIGQLGGQTPINISDYLVGSGHKLLGSSLESMALAEDRGQFIKICTDLGIKIPESFIASNFEEAKAFAKKIGFPIMCRPSYVLGGRRMEILEVMEDLEIYFDKYASFISETTPFLLDQFLEQALEVDVDLVRGKDWSVIGGILEHIEAAGVHSGDSMAVLPPQRLKVATGKKIERLSLELANKMNIIGFLNLQLAVKNDEVYIIEANPRSSRSVPFIVKSGGVPLVDLGIKAIMGMTKKEIKPEQYEWSDLKMINVKGVVFPFNKFKDADSILGPEMKSTGECMGRGKDYSEALLKALYSSQLDIPDQGEVFLSLREKDKSLLLQTARDLVDMGYTLSGTEGTANYFSAKGVEIEKVNKVTQGRPHCVDRIRSREVGMVINTTSGRESVQASFSIRRSCVDYSIPCLTESDAAIQVIDALKRKKQNEIHVSPL